MNTTYSGNGGALPNPADETVPLPTVEPIEVTPLVPVHEKESYLPKSPAGWIALILAAFAMGIAVVTSIWCLMPVAEVEEQRPSSHIEMTVPVSHEHAWVEDFETVHHEAITHEETVVPVYEAVIEYHTVCNECGAQIDGIGREHIEETGHSGYSTNVPVAVPHLVTEGSIDLVEDSPAYDESITVGRHCSICGTSE